LKTKAHRFVALSGIVSFAALVAVSVFQAKLRAQQPASRPTYYVHGRIYTNDPAHPWAEAMAVTDGKITCIGNLDHVLLDCGGGQEGVETVQLHGQFVMPGFNDAHVHLGGAAADLLAVPLTGVPSAEEMQKRVADAVAKHKAGEWITGGGWDHTLWAEKRFPNRQQLDAV
jgi:predicted amidohydrolase YtcJ